MISVPTPDPNAPKNAFSLSTPRHMLFKLGWEIKQLRNAQEPSDDLHIFSHAAPGYHAFNCAVTAWHIADWIWQYSDPVNKAAIADHFGFKLKKSDRENLASFYDAVAQDCNELRLCRQIANGSKHMLLDKNDANIASNTTWEPAALPRGELIDGNDVPPYVTRCYISDGTTNHLAVDVFQRVARYWRDLGSSFGYFEPPPLP